MWTPKIRGEVLIAARPKATAKRSAASEATTLFIAYPGYNSLI
jgi:hypothetical protein